MIIPSGVSVAGSAVTLATIPAGPVSAAITNAGTVALYVGAGTAATTASGAPIPAGAAVTLGQFSSSSPTRLWGITAGGTVAAGVFISTGA